jgi:maleylacetate reductase
VKFTHRSLPQRVVFAAGEAAARVADEVGELGRSRVMLIASEREGHVADGVETELARVGIEVVVRHEEVVMHVPVAVAERARASAKAAAADAVVTVGGGSTTGLGKTVVMGGSPVAGLPLVAVPTTYAGSEATNLWGMTSKATKRTGVDDRVLPATIVYDASLLTTLPRDVAVASGLNALAHGVDAMWGPQSDPIDRASAAEGIRGLASGLRLVSSDCSSIAGIEQTLYGAYLAAIAFASAGSGMHHKICHVLGGMFDLPHAQTHAVVLPHVLAFNVPSAPEAAARIATALGADSATAGLRALTDELDAPRSLKDYGMPRDGIARALPAIRAAVPADNPTPITDANLTALLEAAWSGDIRGRDVGAARRGTRAAVGD